VLKYFPDFGYYLLGDLATILIKESVANKNEKNVRERKPTKLKEEHTHMPLWIMNYLSKSWS
jgi:hypothetical protein